MDQILNDHQVRQKLRRIAFEIYENNYQYEELVLAGIKGKGYQLARLILEELRTISKLKLEVVQINIDKQDPLRSDVSIDVDPKLINNKVVVLVDDVMNTGRTLAYGLKAFLNNSVKKIEIAVLVNREHKAFPLSATYKGYELATSINNYVKVVAEDELTVFID